MKSIKTRILGIVGIIFVTIFVVSMTLLSNLHITYIDGDVSYYLLDSSYAHRYLFITYTITTITIMSLIYYAMVTYEKKISSQKSEIDKKNDLIVFDYFHDKLTKLNNRNALVRDVANSDFKYVIILDVQAFSIINDLYGTEFGDKVLREVAKKLRVHVRPFKLYKIGADQYGILINKVSDEFSIERFTQGIIKYFHDNHIVIPIDKSNNLDISIIFKAGIAENSEANPIENADIALKYCKKSSKNFLLYSNDLEIKDRYIEDIKITKLVKRALAEDRVVVYFQPIFKDNGTTTHECLVRIVDGDKVILPYMFLDVIKNTHYYHRISKVVIEKSFKAFQNREGKFSINLSFLDISNRDLVVYLKRKIVEYDIGDRLIVELLESESLVNLTLVQEFIKEVKAIGVQIAIDDFGSGYSNFSYLLELEPDYIKIDGSIIKNIATDEKAFMIGRNIANFSNDLNIKVIAEFIHNEEVYRKAKEMGVFGFQGFHLSEPQDKPLLHI